MNEEREESMNGKSWVSGSNAAWTGITFCSPGPACGRPPGGPLQLLHEEGCVCFGPPSKNWGPSHQL